MTPVKALKYAPDSAAARVFGNPELDAIELLSSFPVCDTRGVTWGVKSVSIATQGYIADVSIVLDRGGALDACLCMDEGFLAAVFAELKKTGYDGPPFERCEMGMPGDTVVMLEPNPAFTEFAIGKGFKLLR